ncbi:MAG TPA: hypothetical protein VH208_12680 [Myxococcaceae bacterium]|nr:hypothetical protein [Myxococcaceae bacterium]
MSARLVWVALLTTSCAPVSRELSRVATAIEAEYGLEQESIPFAGVASFIASAWGVSDLDFAVFDSPRRSIDPLDDRWTGLMTQKLGDSWRAIVRVRSRDEGWTTVYAKVTEGGWRLMVFSQDEDELVVVRLKVKPTDLRRWLDDPGEMSPVRRATAIR